MPSSNILQVCVYFLIFEPTIKLLIFAMYFKRLCRILINTWYWHVLAQTGFSDLVLHHPRHSACFQFMFISDSFGKHFNVKNFTWCSRDRGLQCLQEFSVQHPSTKCWDSLVSSWITGDQRHLHGQYIFPWSIVHKIN